MLFDGERSSMRRQFVDAWRRRVGGEPLTGLAQQIAAVVELHPEYHAPLADEDGLARDYTPEAGEMWSKEDIDYWIAVLRQISDEAYSNPDIVKTAPHNQSVRKLAPESLDEPDRWAMTWRAHLRKRAIREES